MEKKLGLSALTALVLSSMLGAGVFSLPQNMAAVASPSALLIGWAITGVGILFLAFAMLLLTRIRPDLDGGIFTYAREGFGELIGFCSAWGYWLCAVIANVSYLVIVFSALSFFTDTPELRLFGDGNTWQSIVGASVLLWVVHFLVLRGVQTAAGINLVATLAKLLPLGAFVALAALAFQLDTFRLDFSGLALGVPVWEQVKNTMLITLWVFIGVEGAVVVSRAGATQARRWPRDAAGGAVGPRGVSAGHPAVAGRRAAQRTGRNAQPVDGGTDGQADGVVGGDRHCRRADRVGVRRLSQLDHHGRGGAFPRRHS
ncbi:Arginine/ornithine antiporter ArcD [Klebsiella pneumoniae]|nr:Arginine/ornithine antiporter ArcD [Klebsiella pneumoniae]